MTAPVDVLAVLDADIERQRIGVAAGRCDPDAMAEFEDARAAVAELIEWQRQAVPLLKAAASWMPVRKCSASIREIDALLARFVGAA